MSCYLATPYSHPDPAVRHQAFVDACKLAGRIMRTGQVVFSPIAHSHFVAELGNLPLDWSFWRVQCLGMLALCDVLWVAMMPGWKESNGVQAEIVAAKATGKPVRYLNVETLTISMEPI